LTLLGPGLCHSISERYAPTTSITIDLSDLGLEFQQDSLTLSLDASTRDHKRGVTNISVGGRKLHYDHTGHGSGVFTSVDDQVVNGTWNIQPAAKHSRHPHEHLQFIVEAIDGALVQGVNFTVQLSQANFVWISGVNGSTVGEVRNEPPELESLRPPRGLDREDDLHEIKSLQDTIAQLQLQIFIREQLLEERLRKLGPPPPHHGGPKDKHHPKHEKGEKGEKDVKGEKKGRKDEKAHHHQDHQEFRRHREEDVPPHHGKPSHPPPPPPPPPPHHRGPFHHRPGCPPGLAPWVRERLPPPPPQDREHGILGQFVQCHACCGLRPWFHHGPPPPPPSSSSPMHHGWAHFRGPPPPLFPLFNFLLVIITVGAVGILAYRRFFAARRPAWHQETATTTVTVLAVEEERAIRRCDGCFARLVSWFCCCFRRADRGIQLTGDEPAVLEVVVDKA
jgi:hypothetical protein